MPRGRRSTELSRPRAAGEAAMAAERPPLKTVAEFFARLIANRAILPMAPDSGA
jgi:hypothetical protein